MKGPWKVTTQVINGLKKYAVYRLRDVNEVDHTGNREFAGDYVDDQQTAELVAYVNNMQEKTRQEDGQE